jgi:hypothetical protein
VVISFIFGDSKSPFSAGYDIGVTSGKLDGGPGRTAPSADYLNALAHNMLAGSEFANKSESDKESYMDGVRAGYESGFKDASKPAF